MQHGACVGVANTMYYKCSTYTICPVTPSRPHRKRPRPRHHPHSRRRHQEHRRPRHPHMCKLHIAARLQGPRNARAEAAGTVALTARARATLHAAICPRACSVIRAGRWAAPRLWGSSGNEIELYMSATSSGFHSIRSRCSDAMSTERSSWQLSHTISTPAKVTSFGRHRSQ